MTDISPSRSTRQLDRRLRAPDRAVLPEQDYLHLQRHLDRCEKERGMAWTLLAYVLQQKIASVDPVPDTHLPDLVTGSCRVGYVVSCRVGYVVSGGERQVGLMTHRARSGLGNDIIPVASLLGATLIGMRAGQRRPLLCVDGSVRTITVLDVAQPT